MQDALEITIPRLNIAGFHVRELVCKNDDCSTLLGWQNVKRGVVIHQCHVCKKVSVWRFSYSKTQANMDILVETMKGGETK